MCEQVFIHQAKATAESTESKDQLIKQLWLLLDLNEILHPHQP